MPANHLLQIVIAVVGALGAGAGVGVGVVLTLRSWWDRPGAGPSRSS